MRAAGNVTGGSMGFGDNQIDGYAEGEEPLVFYHQRGEFRKYEAEQYRDLATGKNQPKRGLFRVLVSTKGNRFMFTIMVMVFAVVILVRVLGGKTSEGTVNGVFCDLSAFSMEDTVYASVKIRTSAAERDRLGKNAVVPPKDLHFSFAALDKDGAQSAADELDVVYDDAAAGGKEKIVRVSFTDYDIARVQCTVSSGDADPVTLSTGVEIR